jgi:membrane fusion protein, copper/silver efflux system
MKKNYIVSLLLGTLTISITACTVNSAGKDVDHQHGGEKHSGFNHEVIDSGLSYLIKPVNEQVISSIPTIKAESGTRIFSEDIEGKIAYDTRYQTRIASRVSGRIERLLIKYNYQPVQNGQLIMEIYSPDLAAAQRELLYIQQSGGDSNLMQKAKQRLLLLGMQPAQISQVLKTGKPLYRVPVYSNTNGYILETTAANTSSINSATASQTPSSGGDGMSGMGGMSGGGSGSAAAVLPTSPSSPVLIREGQYVSAGQSLFTIYKSGGLVAEFALKPKLVSEIKRGQKLVFHLTADPEKVYSGYIGLIQPKQRAGENFTLTRVYINHSKLKVGQLVSASIPVVQRGWWLPKTAVYQLGSKSVVFKKENGVFIPKEVKTGTATKGLIQVLDSIGNWPVASNAYYLIDSESFVKIISDTTTQQ